MGNGYDADFLGSHVPLPFFSEALEDDILERDTLSNTVHNSSDNDGGKCNGRRVYRHYQNYTIVMSKKYRTALYAALNVDQSLLEKTDKTVGWRVDDAVGSEYQLNGDYYVSNAWDKGHLAPDAAAGWGVTKGTRIAATNDTYFYTNATLQHENFNRDEWKDLETYVRVGLFQDDSTNHKMSEITGPIFVEEEDATNTTRTVQPEGREAAVVPAGFFKVVAYISGNNNQLVVRCFVIYQDAQSLEDRGGVVDHKRYQVTIPNIEELTGLLFDPIYHEANNVVDVDEGEIVEEETSDSVVEPSSSPSENTNDNNASPGVCIAAAMVNPAGKDSGNEWISIQNLSDKTVNFHGWKLEDQQGRTLRLEEEVESGGTIIVKPISPIRLNNTGGALTLFNEAGHMMHRVEYIQEHVEEGVALEFQKMS